MPRTKPIRYFIQHSWPQRYRRCLYGLLSVVMAFAYYGSSALQGGDRVAPILFATASAACLVGVIRVDSHRVWLVSGIAVFVSFTWRLGQVFATELGWTDQEPPDSSAMASAAYVFACLSVPAVWRWLRPRASDG